MNAQQLKDKMAAMIATRTLVQVIDDMRVLDEKEYNAQIARVYNMYTNHVAATWPAMDEAAWAVLDAAEAEHEFPSYREALEIALQIVTEKAA